MKVTEAGEDQFEAAIKLITLCFVDDPVCRYLYPGMSQYLEFFPEYVRIYGEKGVGRGGTHIYGDQGAALWVPPHVHPDEDALDALLDRSVAPDAKAELFDVYAEFDRAHPSEPHWFLPLMGVDPFMKRKGIGAALMQHGLDTCDRDGTIAYLESTKPENVPFYDRFGFKPHATLEVGDHPKVITMVRPPASLTARHRSIPDGR